MVKWLSLPLFIGLTLGPACVHSPSKSGPYVWQLRGVVVSVTDSRLQVRHKTGGILDLQIDDRTAYVRNRQPDSRRSLLQGTRVMVEVETVQRDVYRARVVEIFGGGSAE